MTDSSESDISRQIALVEKLESRSSYLRIFSLIILFALILPTLGFGAVIISRAGFIVAAEQQQILSAQRQTEEDRIREKLVYAIASKAEAEALIQSSQEIISEFSSNVPLLPNERELLLAARKDSARYKAILARLTVEIPQIKIQIDSFNDQDSQPSEQEWREKVLSFINVNVTRFGSTILIIFIITILVSLYKYNMRLASHYDSIADALVIAHADIDISEFVESASVTASKVNFSKTTTVNLDTKYLERIADIATKFRK